MATRGSIAPVVRQSEAAQATKSKEIEITFARLAESVAVLENAIEGLEQRLVPIFGGESPEKKAYPDERFVAPLANAINDMAVRVREINGRIFVMEERIEL